MKNKIGTVIWFTYIQVLRSKWFVLIALLGIMGIIASTQYKEIAKMLGVGTLSTQDVSTMNIQLSGSEATFILQFIIVIILFLLILIYGSNIANSIVEEKSGRIIETLLCYIRPTQLLGGKILAYVFGIATQAGIWAVVYFVLKKILKVPANSIFILLDSVNQEMLILLCFSIVFGFVMYAFAFAALASFADNAQDSTQLTMPIGLIIMAVYFISLAVMNGLDGNWVDILSYAPFFSPIMTFVVINTDMLSLGILSIRLGVMLIETIVIAIVCSKIYRRGVVNYGIKKISIAKIFSKRKNCSCHRSK